MDLSMINLSTIESVLNKRYPSSVGKLSYRIEYITNTSYSPTLNILTVKVMDDGDPNLFGEVLRTFRYCGVDLKDISFDGYWYTAKTMTYDEIINMNERKTFARA